MKTILEKLEKLDVIGGDSNRVGTGIILLSIGLPLLWLTSVFVEFSLNEFDWVGWVSTIILMILYFLLPSVIVWSIRTCKNLGVRRILFLTSISMIVCLIVFLALSDNVGMPTAKLFGGITYVMLFGVVFLLPWLLCKLAYWVISGFKETRE